MKIFKIQNPDPNIADIIAMTLSGLCVIHCLAMPLLFLIFPLAIGIFDEEWVHKLLVMIALPTSVWALSRNHTYKNLKILLPIGFGLLGLLFSAFLPALHDYETLISVISASMLAFGHFQNAQNHHRGDK